MKTIYKLLLGSSLVALLFSCHKEDKLNVKIENYDTFTPGVIDEWLTKNFTDPYNIEVVYRYQRNMHDLNKNIAPVEEAKVIPQMEIVKNGFLEVYGKIGGMPFIKEYTPKQFVLFGSGDYDPDGSVKGGTADGGRRITLYGLNGLNVSNPNVVQGNLQVVHHEFTHILNQTRVIPPDYEMVSVGNYYANWTAQENTAILARSLGFITPYARKSVGEDFAEVLSHLIVAGQLYYNNIGFVAGRDAYTKFKRKESIVRDYMMQHFFIDVTLLQMEFQRVMEEKYNSQNYRATTAWNNNYFDALNWDIREPWAVANTVSSKQRSVLTPILNGFGGWRTKTVQFKFASATKATLQITFGNDSNTYAAYYDFTLARLPSGSYSIVKSQTQGTDANYGNGNLDWVLAATQPLITYLGSTSFNVAWKDDVADTLPADYLKFLVLTDSNDQTASLLGNVSYKKY